MSNMICFLGGASAVGKTTMIKHLEQYHGVKRYKLKWAVHKAGLRKGIPKEDCYQYFEELTPAAIHILTKEIFPLNKRWVIDVHYAVQPTLSLARSRGEDIEEDLNEAYVDGIDGRVLQELAKRDFDMFFALIVAPRDQILVRRMERKENNNSGYRSLNPLSIDREQGAEIEWFDQVLADVNNARNKMGKPEVAYKILLGSDNHFQNNITSLINLFENRM